MLTAIFIVGIINLCILILYAYFNFKEQHIMAASITDLDGAIANIESEDATLATILAQVLADLQAKNGQSADLTPEVTRLQNVLTALQGIQNTATAADPGPAAPTA